jgi:hypothetical protein
MFKAIKGREESDPEEGLLYPDEGPLYPEEGLLYPDEQLPYPFLYPDERLPYLDEGLLYPEEELLYSVEGLLYQEEGLLYPDEGRPEEGNQGDGKDSAEWFDPEEGDEIDPTNSLKGSDDQRKKKHERKLKSRLRRRQDTAIPWWRKDMSIRRPTPGYTRRKSRRKRAPKRRHQKEVYRQDYRIFLMLNST